MANNYCESSSGLAIPEGKELLAAKIIARISAEIDESGEYGSIDVSIEEEKVHYVWMRSSDGSFDTEAAVKYAEALVEGLDIRDPFIISFSYTCDRPCLDEFGGGAVAIQKGKPTIWVDAVETIKGMITESQVPEVPN